MHGLNVRPNAVDNFHRLSPERTWEFSHARFGTEHSFRLEETACPRTADPNAPIRMLYVAVALFEWNEWGLRKHIHPLERRRGRRGFTVRDERLRFDHLVARPVK
jgi:hypothetical protein